MPRSYITDSLLLLSSFFCAYELPFLSHHLSSNSRKLLVRLLIGGIVSGWCEPTLKLYAEFAFCLCVVVAESKWKCMKPQECHICHKTFSNAGNLRQHITNVHTPGEPVRCEVCFKEFKNKEYLRKHKVIIHKAPIRKHKFFHVNSIPWNLWATQNLQQWHSWASKLHYSRFIFVIACWWDCFLANKLLWLTA